MCLVISNNCNSIQREGSTLVMEGEIMMITGMEITIAIAICINKQMNREDMINISIR